MFSREVLLAAAREAAKNSHCHYSHFHVGAVVVAGEKIYLGVNIDVRYKVRTSIFRCL